MPSKDRDQKAAPKVLLVHPPIYDFAAFDFYVYPLGLVHLAHSFEQHGYGVTLIDSLDRFAEIAADPGLKKPTFRGDGCGHFHCARISAPTPLASIPRRFHRFGLPKPVLQARLAEHDRPAAVAITCTMTYWYLGVQEVVELVRARWPEVPLLLGGTYPLCCPEHAKEHSGADWIQERLDLGSMFDFLKEIADEPPAREKLASSGHNLLGRRDSAAVQTSS
ncbi:MAG: hypothetical protein KJ645_14040 [Planctomycetes bacterium]|nr:hypothetical protein [Planctomycetota bacterium]